MAEPVHFPGVNFTFGAPDDRDDILDLHVFRQPNGPANVSCWRLTQAELNEINRSGCVFLSVMSGRMFFPVYVGSETSVRALVLDSGTVWERGK